MLRIACLLGIIASPVAAECLTYDPDIGFENVPFGLKDGGDFEVSVSTEDANGVMSMYSDRYGEPLYSQGSYWGVYPAYEEFSVTVDPGTGETTPWPMVEAQFETHFAKTPPEPGSVGSWKSNGTATARVDGVETKYNFTANYSFEPEKMAKLKGCEYRMIPVVAEFTADGANWGGRWAYFPDFKVAVQTKGHDSRTGANWTNGITSIGWE